MKHQALFSSKDKSKKYKSVVCCNFAWHFKVKSVRTWRSRMEPTFIYSDTEDKWIHCQYTFRGSNYNIFILGSLFNGVQLIKKRVCS